MDRKKAEQKVISPYRQKLLDRAQKLVVFLTRKVEKAIKRGRVEVIVSRRPISCTLFFLFSPRKLFNDTECFNIAKHHFEDLGFDFEWLKWCEFVDKIRISWRPENLTDGCVVCTEDGRLRHLVMTGQAPRVIEER